MNCLSLRRRGRREKRDMLVTRIQRQTNSVHTSCPSMQKYKTGQINGRDDIPILKKVDWYRQNQ